TILGNTVYHTQTGTLAYQTEEVVEKVAQIRAQAELQLAISDQIINGDLLRFYTPDGFVPVDKSLHGYVDSPSRLEEDIAELGDLNTSLYYTNNGVSTVPLYQTDAPEFPANQAIAEENAMQEQPAAEEVPAEGQTETVE
ncbi:MAG: LTA synthase family protein, partial [Trichococcus flocculiformis]